MANLLVVLFLSLAYLSLAISSNPAIVENDLGNIATACASKFCTSKDSLDIWLDIEYDCHRNEEVAGDGSGSSADHVSNIVQAPSRKGRQRKRRLSSDDALTIGGKILVSREFSGLVCSICGLLGMLLGYIIGKKWNDSAGTLVTHVSALDDDDDDNDPSSKKGKMAYAQRYGAAQDYIPIATSEDEGGGRYRSKATLRGVVVADTYSYKR
jgi:hypothetical protein